MINSRASIERYNPRKSISSTIKPVGQLLRRQQTLRSLCSKQSCCRWLVITCLFGTFSTHSSPGGSSLTPCHVKNKGKSEDGEHCQQQNDSSIFNTNRHSHKHPPAVQELLTFLDFPMSSGEEKARYTMGKSKDENEHENRKLQLFLVSRI